MVLLKIYLYFKFYRWTFYNYFRYYNFLVIFCGASVISETFNIRNASLWYKNSRWTIRSSKFLEINRQISCYLGFCYNSLYWFFYDWFSLKKTRSTRYNCENYSYYKIIRGVLLPGNRLEISIFAHLLKLLRCKLRCQNDLFSFELVFWSITSL